MQRLNKETDSDCVSNYFDVQLGPYVKGRLILRVLENRVLRYVFRPKTEEVTCS